MRITNMYVKLCYFCYYCKKTKEHSTRTSSNEHHFPLYRFHSISLFLYKILSLKSPCCYPESFVRFWCGEWLYSASILVNPNRYPQRDKSWFLSVMLLYPILCSVTLSSPTIPSSQHTIYVHMYIHSNSVLQNMTESQRNK